MNPPTHEHIPPSLACVGTIAFPPLVFHIRTAWTDRTRVTYLYSRINDSRPDAIVDHRDHDTITVTDSADEASRTLLTDTTTAQRLLSILRIRVNTVTRCRTSERKPRP